MSRETWKMQPLFPLNRGHLNGSSPHWTHVSQPGVCEHRKKKSFEGKRVVEWVSDVIKAGLRVKWSGNKFQVCN